MVPLQFLDVSKALGGRAIVKALSFVVNRGEIFGFLGGNGAGKTTSIRMMLDITRPDFGSINILGSPPARGNRLKLGFLPEERGLYRNMTALDTVVYFARLKGVDAPTAQRRAHRLLERFDLGSHAKTLVQNLSKGMGQKIQLATAIVNEPELLILDEPFSGLDPLNQSFLEDEIRRLAGEGRTVIFSTHIMQHAERLCDRLLFLDNGRKAFEGTVDQACNTLAARLFVVSREPPENWPGVLSATRQGELEGGDWAAWRLELTAGSDPQDVLEFCTARSIALRAFDAQRPTLHDAFIHIVDGTEERG